MPKKSKHVRNKERQGVLGFINEHPGCGVGQIAIAHGLSDRSVANYFTTLVLEGQIDVKYENGVRTAYPADEAHLDRAMKSEYPDL